MKDITKQAEKIANETSIEIINNQIEEWKKSLELTKQAIIRLNKDADNELGKIQLWETAKIYKGG